MCKKQIVRNFYREIQPMEILLNVIFTKLCRSIYHKNQACTLEERFDTNQTQSTARLGTF